VVWLLASPAQAKYSGGSGTVGDPYQISTPNDMNAIGADPCDWDKHFLLTADIDLAGYTGEMFNIIGDYPDNPFTGVFDGNGHTISNFTYSTQDKLDIGLFGIIGWDESAQVKNVHLVEPNVSDPNGAWIGALVGDSADGTISNCSVTGGSVTGRLGLGGLCGVNGGIITDSFVDDVTVSQGTENGSILGGLVGYNFAGDISSCYATASVTGYKIIGGLAGENRNGAISNSYARRGRVSGEEDVGGLVGNIWEAGSVSGTTDVGGLIGEDWDSTGTVTDSFWDKETSGKTTSAGGTGKTTVEMKKESTFTNWDFVEIWNIGEEQTYPFLRVYPAGDLNHDGRVDFVDFAIIGNNWQIGVE
jgi:hypothetical protein